MSHLIGDDESPDLFGEVDVMNETTMDADGIINLVKEALVRLEKASETIELLSTQNQVMEEILLKALKKEPELWPILIEMMTYRKEPKKEWIPSLNS